MSSQDREDFWLDDRLGWALWRLAREITQLQQPHGHRRQQAQQTDQALTALQLSFFNATSRFAHGMRNELEGTLRRAHEADAHAELEEVIL